MNADARHSLCTWCDVDVTALTHNVATLRRRLRPGARLGVVVKADAYGHGLATVATALAPSVDWLIINSADEGIALRRVLEATPWSTLPIYCCGPVLPFQARQIVDADVRTVVTDLELVRALGAYAEATGRRARVHLKVETGTHRQGLDLISLPAFARATSAVAGVVVEGVTTHYADIEDTTDHRFADRQRRLLDEGHEAVRAVGVDVAMVHSANSAATILDARTHGDLVRVGIAAYGLWPSKETQAAWLEQRLREHGTLPPRPTSADDVDVDFDHDVPTLRPVLAWRARLTQVKDVPAGGYVGYGRTYRATHPIRIGIIPVGYHEGYDRRLSNVGHVVVDGVRCPVRGRVCMNMMMVDVTDVPGAVTGSVATLLGSDGEETVSAEQLASWMGTIHYEVTSRIHPSVARLPVA